MKATDSLEEIMLSFREAAKHRRPNLSTLLVFFIILTLLAPSIPGAAQDTPPAPGNLRPVNDSLVTATGYDDEPGYSAYVKAPPTGTPEFSWNPVAGATLYRLQISRDYLFTSTVLNITTANTRYTPLILSTSVLMDGEWYWRVRVEKPTIGDYQQPGSEPRFVKLWASPDNAPQLAAPSNEADLDFYDSPIFSWSAVLGAASYNFQIAASPDSFNAPVFQATTIQTTYQPAAKLENGGYYWRVVPIDAGGNRGESSEIRAFMMSYGVKDIFDNDIPQLIEPPDGDFPTFTPTFRWTAVRGAEYYYLQYTSAPDCNFSSLVTKSITTRNTSYTPTDALPNDVNYCWHVKAVSGKSSSDFSDTWEFIKHWYIQAQPLTPTNNYQYVRYPLLSWTPVPGAKRYKVEVSHTGTFPPTSPGWIDHTANTTYIKPDKYLSRDYTWSWRITPIDYSNNEGQPSTVFSFRPIQSEPFQYPVPQLIYPLYYYEPRQDTNPVEDRSVSHPIFVWSRTLQGEDQSEVPAYRLQVSTSDTFDVLAWAVDTENLSASPTSGSGFQPQDGGTYYWRVCALEALDGSCLSAWSQIWKTSIDTSKGLTPTQPGPPVLLRPEHGHEAVETIPMLEWWPVQGAGAYDVEISTDPSFEEAFIVDSASVDYPAYTPSEKLIYPSGDLPYGTYYWRVCAQPGSECSTPRRFQVAAQSHWVYARTLGDPAKRYTIAFDPVDGGLPPGSDLTGLYGAQDNQYWYFGLDTSILDSGIAYGLYIDLDHLDGSGGTFDPRGYPVSAIPAHRPEHVIYFLDWNGVYDGAVYSWTGGGWSSPQWLSDLVTDVDYYNYVGGYLELRIPFTAIGMGPTTGSAALALFSADTASQAVLDTVPTSTSLSVLDRFASLSERLSLAMPPTNNTGDPSLFPSVLPFFWHWPPVVPWEGYKLEISRDPLFTTRDYEYTLTATSPYLASGLHTTLVDVIGDNTYYWRVQPQYYHPSINIKGAWSLAGRFERRGFVPQNLSESVTFATPTFSWGMVEGAEAYVLELSTNANFSSTVFSITTANTSYTWTDTLANGTYYWRVQARRYNNIKGAWSGTQSFDLGLPVPEGLTPHDPGQTAAVAAAPTMCWEPLIELDEDDGYPVLAAWKYRVQVSTTSNFSVIFDNIDTEQACWTPIKGYPDGTYYWRVAMFDGRGRLGDYTAAYQFTKQYPIVNRISPPNGVSHPSTPTFVWAPVDGAAKYRLEVSLYPTYSPTVDVITTVNARYTPVKAYDPSETYYWRVAMIDKDGRIGPFPEVPVIVPKGKIYLPLMKK
jgi:hypothetical protein